jgi:hypothetical protein
VGAGAPFVALTSFSVTVVESVPEAATWAMMLSGFAGLGFLGYRRSIKARIAA